MIDITKHIQLNKPHQKKIYFALQILLFITSFLSLIILIKNLLFPTFTFNFDTNVDSLANTISHPYEAEHGTSFHLSSSTQTDTIKVTITLPKDLDQLPSNTTLLAKKSYLAFLSPINKTKYDYIHKTYTTPDAWYINKNDSIFKIISESAFDSYLFKDNINFLTEPTIDTMSNTLRVIGFAPATLISSNTGIFITDKNLKHPIQDEAVFKSFGYDFDNVIKSTSEEHSLHKKAKMFTSSSTHPFGTIFHTTDTDKTFIFDNSLLNKIQTTNLTSQHAISVQEKSRTTIDSCVLKKTIFSKQYSCTMNLDNISEFDGNVYQFTLDNAPNTKLDLIKIQLYTQSNKKSFFDRITTLKKELDIYYNQTL